MKLNKYLNKLDINELCQLADTYGLNIDNKELLIKNLIKKLEEHFVYGLSFLTDYELSLVQKNDYQKINQELIDKLLKLNIILKDNDNYFPIKKINQELIDNAKEIRHDEIIPSILITYGILGIDKIIEITNKMGFIVTKEEIED